MHAAEKVNIGESSLRTFSYNWPFREDILHLKGLNYIKIILNDYAGDSTTDDNEHLQKSLLPVKNSILICVSTKDKKNHLFIWRTRNTKRLLHLPVNERLYEFTEDFLRRMLERNHTCKYGSL